MWNWTVIKLNWYSLLTRTIDSSINGARAFNCSGQIMRFHTMLRKKLCYLTPFSMSLTESWLLWYQWCRWLGSVACSQHHSTLWLEDKSYPTVPHSLWQLRQTGRREPLQLLSKISSISHCNYLVNTMSTVAYVQNIYFTSHTRTCSSYSSKNFLSLNGNSVCCR